MMPFRNCHAQCETRRSGAPVDRVHPEAKVMAGFLALYYKNSPRKLSNDFLTIQDNELTRQYFR